MLLMKWKQKWIRLEQRWKVADNNQFTDHSVGFFQCELCDWICPSRNKKKLKPIASVPAIVWGQWDANNICMKYNVIEVKPSRAGIWKWNLLFANKCSAKQNRFWEWVLVTLTTLNVLFVGFCMFVFTS